MTTNPIRYRLKYVGGPQISTVRFLHVKDSTNDRYFYDETVAEVEAITFETTGSAQDIVIESLPLFVVQFVTNPTINSVRGQLSTHKDNWVDWKTHFSFGDYYGKSPIFDVRLGGVFHVKDGNFATLNGIYRGFTNITNWDKLIFRDYKDGSILNEINHSVPIVGLVETFKDNTKLNDILVGTLQYLPHIESIRMCWMNTALNDLKTGVFAYQNKLMDIYQAFNGTNIDNLPPRVIAIG